MIRTDRSLGNTLRQVRLDRGISLDSAARDTRIRRTYLEAMEAEDASRLPLPVYTRGFVRSYAEYLGLDPQAMLDLYQPAEQETLPPPLQRAAPRVPIPRQLPVRPVLSVVGAVLMLALLVFLWKAYQDARQGLTGAEAGGPVHPITPTRPPSVPTPLPIVLSPLASPSPALFSTPSPVPLLSPSPVAAATPSPSPIEGILVEFKTTDSVYVEASVDGQVAVQQTFPAGTDKTLPLGQHSVVLRVSDPQAVSLVVNGEPQTAATGSSPVEYSWQR